MHIVHKILKKESDNILKKEKKKKQKKEDENYIFYGDAIEHPKYGFQFDSKKYEKITHPFLNEKVEWGMVPYVQAMLLARYIRGDMNSYPPFMWK